MNIKKTICANKTINGLRPNQWVKVFKNIFNLEIDWIAEENGKKEIVTFFNTRRIAKDQGAKLVQIIDKCGINFKINYKENEEC